jgi:hypothetical protein
MEYEDWETLSVGSAKSIHHGPQLWKLLYFVQIFVVGCRQDTEQMPVELGVG